MKATGTFIKTGIFALLAATFMATTALAQERGNDKPRQSPNASGRPGINDRPIFGRLVPFNQVWRTGANESTAITFTDDVVVEGKPVEAGTYSLYTIPGEDEWTVIINSKMSWGTQYDESQDVLRVEVEPQEAETREQFMIHFENVTDRSADVVLHWESTKVPFTVET